MQDVPSVVPVWVRLPHLPLHCWYLKSLEFIGNTLGKYIDRADRKEQYSCATICVEFDLEVGLPKSIQLKVADWSYIQELDYEQLPFKCKYCHGYGHFTRHCKKKVEEEVEILKGDQWTQVQKATLSKYNNRSKWKGTSKVSGTPSVGNALGEGNSALPIPEASKNPFEILSNPPEILDPMFEELEQQILSLTTGNNNVEILFDLPTRAFSSPSYADIIKNKPSEIFISLEDKSFERPSKRAGRKSHKEAREEEVERQKM
jgi:hypothetical protein